MKILLVSAGFVIVPDWSNAQPWAATTAPVKAWNAVASSADGSKLVAVWHSNTTSNIWTSTDSGGTWISNNVANLAWDAVASSADGSVLAAVAVTAFGSANSGIYTSTNGGTIWQSNTVAGYDWHSVAVSADGSTVALAPYASYVAVSTNSGQNWFSNSTPQGVADLNGVALSANGQILAAANNIGYVLISTNWAKTWNITNKFPMGGNPVIAMSADASKLAIVYGQTQLFVSTNGGYNWFTNTFPTAAIKSVTTSADGSQFVAVGNQSEFISTNTGRSWTSNGLPVSGFVSIASSADGSQLAAAVNGGTIWVSQTTPRPQINLSSSHSNLKLSWNEPATNFVLQQSTDLQHWTNSPTGPALNPTNLQEEVYLSTTNRNLFYRLKTP